MKFRAKIEVRSKKGQTEPESETVKKALIDLGFKVLQTRTSKLYEIILESATKRDAEVLSKTICARLLVNPVKDDFVLEVEQVGNISGNT